MLDRDEANNTEMDHSEELVALFFERLRASGEKFHIKHEFSKEILLFRVELLTLLCAKYNITKASFPDSIEEQIKQIDSDSFFNYPTSDANQYDHDKTFACLPLWSDVKNKLGKFSKKFPPEINLYEQFSNDLSMIANNPEDVILRIGGSSLLYLGTLKDNKKSNFFANSLTPYNLREYSLWNKQVSLRPEQASDVFYKNTKHLAKLMICLLLKLNINLDYDEEDSNFPYLSPFKKLFVHNYNEIINRNLESYDCLLSVATFLNSAKHVEKIIELMNKDEYDHGNIKDVISTCHFIQFFPYPELCDQDPETHKPFNNSFSYSPLSFAVMNNNLDLFKLIFNFLPEEYSKKVHDEDDDSEYLELARLEHDYQLLRLAIKYDAIDIVKYLLEIHPEMVDKGYVEFDEDTNKTDYDSYFKMYNMGNTPLHFAVLYQKIEIIKIIFEVFENKYKQIPEWVVNIYKDKFVNHPNLFGETSLYLAIPNAGLEIVQLLIKNGAKLHDENICIWKHFYPDMKKSIVTRYFNTNANNNEYLCQPYPLLMKAFLTKYLAENLNRDKKKINEAMKIIEYLAQQLNVTARRDIDELIDNYKKLYFNRLPLSYQKTFDKLNNGLQNCLYQLFRGKRKRDVYEQDDIVAALPPAKLRRI